MRRPSGESSGFQTARLVDASGIQQQGKGIQHARTADALRRSAAYGAEAQALRGIGFHGVDGPVLSGHAAGKSSALEAGTGGSGAGQQLAVSIKHRFGIGAQIHQQEGLLRG